MRLVHRVLAGATAALLGASAFGDGIPRLFKSWAGYDTGTYPNSFGPASMSPADMDGDGDTDVIVGLYYYASPGLAVLRNLGDGSYAQPVHYLLPYGQCVGDVAPGDIDGDGDMDVVATIPDSNGFTNKVAIWKNHGDGTLAPRTEYSTGAPGPMGLALADFDDDGAVDVATANYGYFGQGTTISILRNNGSGELTAAENYTVGSSPLSIAAADLSGDLHPDLVVGLQSGGLRVLLNDGAGGFGSPAAYIPANNPIATIGLVDIDGDGDIDIVGAGSGEQGSINFGLVGILKNNGDGIFAAPLVFQMDNFSAPSADYAFGDLNADGWPDVLACDPSARATDGLRVLLSDGAGGFQKAEHYPSAQMTVAVGAVDADGDGTIDAITLARESSEVTVHLNSGNGTLERPPLYATGSIFGNQIDAADIDADGDLDVAVSHGSLGVSGTVAVLKNNGVGSFDAGTLYFSPQQAMSVRLSDLNSDGLPDLLWADAYPPYNFKTRMNLGDGTFGPLQNWISNNCGNGGVGAFDLDNDGDLDVALVESQSCPGIPFSGRRLFVYSNDGSGTFTLAGVLVGTTGVIGVDAADFDNDGNLDLLTLSAGLAVFLGNGDLSFQAPLTTPGEYSTFGLADFDQDGKIDAAVSKPADSFGTDSIGIARGQGNGTFLPPKFVTGSSVLENLAVTVGVVGGDVNSDGVLDVISANYASNDHSVFLGNGDGTLQPQVRYGSAHFTSSMVVADFTGDEIIDIVSVVSLPPSGLSSAVAVLPGYKPCASGDLNCDGKVDQQDLGILLAAYGTCLGQPGFNPVADIDKDGCVGQSDLGILLAHYGA